MKLNKMLNKARNNKTKTTQTTLKNNGLNIKIEYRPNAEGFNSQYKDNTFWDILKKCKILLFIFKKVLKFIATKFRIINVASKGNKKRLQELYKKIIKKDDYK